MTGGLTDMLLMIGIAVLAGLGAYRLYAASRESTDDAVVDASSLPRVRMPNRDGFIPDARPDVGTAAGRP